jgi:hypothetical protein
MGRLFVGSVYSKDGIERNRQWYDLQTKFLRATTKNYQHFVCAEEDTFEGDHVFLQKKYEPVSYWHHLCRLGQKNKSQNEQYYLEHVNGLKTLIDEFRRQIEFGWLLILDSDAFPIVSGWQKTIPEQMNERKKKWASAVRMECLDIFPHPCVWLVPRRSLSVLDSLADMTVSYDICGRGVSNIGSGMSREEVFPLVKTNTWSPHPFMSTVYYGAFYHHAGGSRVPGNKSMLYYRPAFPEGYYGSFYDQTSESVFTDTEAYLSRLSGLPVSFHG